eukprot:scaffold3973_cov161-Amphora_coffeaeformis.AAC.2
MDDSDKLLSDLRTGRLTEIKIDANPPTDWSVLVEASQACSLERISVANVKLGGPAEAAFVQLLRHHHATLRHVSLEGLSLSVSASRVLVDALSGTTALESLSLAHNGTLGPRGIKMWCEFLKQARQLFHLDCEACGMGHFGAQAVGQVLPRTLQSLNLSRNKLGADGIWKMASRLANLTDLQLLDLSNNQIGDDGCLELARNLAAHNAALEKLLLGNNDQGCVVLVEGLLPLDKDGESESDEGDSDLEHDGVDQKEDEALSIDHNFDNGKLKKSRLRELHLDQNAIGDEGAGALVEHLDQITDLQTVTLQGNAISDARMRILDMLLKHRTLIASPRKSYTMETSLITPEPSERVEEGNFTESPRKEVFQERMTVDSAAIERGRDAFLSIASSAEEAVIPELPMDYIVHMTDNWNRTTCTHGTYGPLLRAIDKEAAEEGEAYLWLVRKLELSSAGRMDAIRTTVLAELPTLRHASIATLTATAVDHGIYAFVYDIPDASAIPLRKCLTNPDYRKALTWPVRLHIAWSIADALEFLHSSSSGRKAALHGDLHPDSIYVSSDFNNVYLLDAGMSRLIATDRSRFASGEVVFGLRAYRCPRYERGSIAYDASCDIFSLGVVLSELTTSRLQRSKEKKTGLAYDVYYDCVFARKPLKTDPLAGVSSKQLMQTLGQVTFACLSPRPEQRPTAATVAQILKELQEQEKART